MKRLDGVLILLAVILVLGYLITRPHIGTYYQERVATSLNGGVPRKVVDGQRFPTYEACQKEATADSVIESDLTIIDTCESRTALMWGW